MPVLDVWIQVTLRHVASTTELLLWYIWILTDQFNIASAHVVQANKYIASVGFFDSFDPFVALLPLISNFF